MKRRDFICGIAGLGVGCMITHLIDRKLFPNLSGILKDEFGGFTVNLSSHCNLNCIGCDTYSPLSKPEFVTFEQFSKDIIKLKELAPDDFFKTIKDCNVNFLMTKYPININFSNIEDKLSKYNIDFQYDTVKSNKIFDINTRTEIVNSDYVPQEEGFVWSKNIIDIEGKQDSLEKKLNCPHKGIRVYARGNIYDCYVHAAINAFIDYFKVNIPITKKDYIRIADVKNIKEIDDFLSTPKPLCKYCKQCHNTCFGGEPVDWDFSKREITEWT